MSNVFKGLFTTVPVPQRWEAGSRLLGSLLNFHDTLSYLAWTFSTPRFENIPNRVFADYRKMDPGSVKNAREEAVKLAWIGCEPAERLTFNYWFLDSDGKPLKPVLEAHAREAWTYRDDLWEKHLNRRESPSDSSRRSKAPDHRKISDRPSGKFRWSSCANN
jgi:hypothetical protein